MTDGDNTWRARRARSRSSRHEHTEPAGAVEQSLPLSRRGSAPPPLLFQVDTVDPWHGSHPGYEPHSAPRHEVNAAFERALGPTFDPTSVPLREHRGRRRAEPVEPPAEPVEAPVAQPAEPPVEPPVVEAQAAEVPAVPPTIVAPPVPGFGPVSQAETTGIIAPIPAVYVPPLAALPPAAEPPVVEPPVLEPPVLEAPVLDPPVLEPPVLEAPVLEAPVLEPPVLEPPVYVPPKVGPSASIDPVEEDQLFDQASFDEPTMVMPPVPAEPTFWSPPVPVVEPPAASAPAPATAEPTFWSPPVPAVDAPPTLPPPTLPATPPAPTAAPVSLSKAAPEVDPWQVALQPEAAPFHLEPPDQPSNLGQGPAWFDGRLDPFDFASQFGTPDPAWAPPGGGAAVGLDDGDDGGDGGGRHRIDGAAEPAGRRRRAKRPTRKAPWWELPALVALAIVIAVVVKTFVVQPFYIPSPSMERTLHGCTGCSGDRILVNKPIYDFRDPEPGDIVVFNAPPGWNDEPGSKPPSNPILRAGRGFLQLVGLVPPDGLVLVKRVIAVGGQTVKGVSVDGGMAEHIMISDHGDAGPWRTLVEPYVYINAPDITATFGPVTIPKGRLWVMGDHRNDSADSRYHCGPNDNPSSGVGTCDPVSSTVPVGNVIGKAFVIAWPPSRWRTLGTPGTFAGGIVLPLFFVRRRGRRRYRQRHAA